MRFRVAATVLATTVLLAAGTVSVAEAAAPEQAQPAALGGQSYTKSRAYSSYRMAWVPQFKACLGVYVTATVRATLTVTPIEGGAYHQLHSPRIVNPKMQVTIKKSCDDGAAVKKYHRANTVNYRSYFYGYKCSYNPTFSVAVPWSVGVGITPDCGSKKVAKLGDTQKQARRAYRFKLATDGYAFGWDQRKTDTYPTTLSLCSSVSSYFVLRDTEGADREKAMKKVGFADACVSNKD
ncbi:hypothetical protein EKO23_06630 [Nocardioides guangzhouensis]|uniref:Secreted protein n=1 Tax=Nocardioides guangzhouensis TaxID=2497878 RepID=A0A4Q4ZHE0_9ACTN|nr:hypothetical protein [Nocardioides guangzhouensis]RYP87268.1 hypothetical protein EKO23_06630 [Nocardioides guangzhouensis]